MERRKEAIITINGITIDSAQSMAIRCAIANFLWDLHDPEYRKALGKIGDSYQARLREVEKIIVRDI